MTNIPEGQEATDFLKRWDASKRDTATRNNICQELGITYQRARYWAQELRAIKIEPLRPDEPFQNKILTNTGNIYRLELIGNKRVLIINDLHIPYQDIFTVALILRVIKDCKPDVIILNGDIADFYQISRFNKDPRTIKELQNDLNDVRQFLRQVREAAPRAQLIYCEGNHEDRLRNFLWSKSPELSSLDCLQLVELLGLRIFNIDFVPYNAIIKVNDVFKIEHGDCVSKHSGWTAKAMYEKRGGCGIVGHSHRMGSHLKTSDGDTKGWFENGCLCDLNPEYVKEPNWQQGFSMVTFIDGRFYVQQVPIIKHKFIFDGKMYD